LPESTQNLPLTSGAVTTDATSLRCLLETLERQRTLLERILGALLETHDVRAGPAQGILADYLRPEELAAEFRIRETQLFEWKRKGFGPPRTRIRQLVVYRREAVLRWLLGLEEGHRNDHSAGVGASEIRRPAGPGQAARLPPAVAGVFRGLTERGLIED
jgi:hypothetical protein